MGGGGEVAIHVIHTKQPTIAQCSENFNFID